MEGQLLPAQARFQAAVRTASRTATTARKETRMMRRARGESLTRARRRWEPAGHGGKLACCEARFQRVRYAAYDRSAEHARRPRLRPGRHAGARRAAGRRAASRPTWDSIPTADSLHVGSLVPGHGPGLASALRPHADRAGGRRHRDGGRPQRQAGGAPGHDPGADRPQRPGLARQLARFLAFEGANAARMRNNADWLRGIPPDGLPARHRQALHPELHAAEGVGAEPDGGGDHATPSSATC